MLFDKDNVLVLKAKLLEAVQALSSNEEFDDKIVKQYLTRIAVAILNEDISLEIIKLKIENQTYIQILQDYLGDELKMAARFIFKNYDRTGEHRLFSRIALLNKAGENGNKALLSVHISQELYQELMLAIRQNLLEEASAIFDQFITEELSVDQAIIKLTRESVFIGQAFANDFIESEVLAEIWDHKQVINSYLEFQVNIQKAA